ncbi:hypothetical protein GFER_06810 [Geoalkalibacter ferrihydriticus DSM 17813]|uniref:CheW-like domain-containing protein n=1 Tax=Geoalkalibacter ferrihydriticus DSM 17813 TaxID=1121915 RepID=A0A0C2HVQ1_9BACT|nr:chemotaxis protein CheW [Geoalkalibacter ferrihydriticus]KIH76817.1 hypothetical protein GFER_06810 [Geoalkalibacter ferrihydriticus DSM 17813]
MTQKICLISWGGRLMALSTAQVRKVLQAPRIFPLPPTNFGVTRVFFYQDELVPLLPFESLLAGESDFRQDVCFVLVARSHRGLVGLPVDRVLKVVDPAAGILVAAERKDLIGCDEDFLFAEQRYSFLDIERLLNVFPQMPGAVSVCGPKEA